MYYNTLIKRLMIDIFEFLAAVLCIAFLFCQIWPFTSAAISLKMINGATLSYILYSVLLLLFPVFLLSYSGKIYKVTLLRTLFYAFGTVILFGTLHDLISCRGFINYTYTEGDAVFVNIMWNMPNLFGVLISIAVSALFFALGKWIKRRRRVSYILFLSIVFFTVFVPFIATFAATGYLPRSTWLEKAAFIIPEYLLLTVSLSLCCSSRKLWTQHIWN